MWEGVSPWLFAALYYPTLQVLPLYLFARGPRTETIYRRMATIAVAVAACGWLPTARRLATDVAGGKVRLAGATQQSNIRELGRFPQYKSLGSEPALLTPVAFPFRVPSTPRSPPRWQPR